MATTLAVITGSVRQDRFGDTIIAWLSAQLKERGTEVDHLDLVDEEFADDMSERSGNTAFGRRIATADAVVVVTPEYNHSFPGPLKKAIDSLREEWKAKPVGFVSYGGISGGLRAVEALRLVFAELHAVTVRDTVSFHMPWGKFDEAGRNDDEQAGKALNQMLAGLDWWAQAVKNARATTSYPN